MALNLFVFLSILYCASAHVAINFYDEDPQVNALNHCEYQECESYCKRLGYRSGICENDHCECYHKMADGTKNTNDMSFNVGNTGVNELRSCNLRACEQLCRRLGFPGGACMGDKCKCDNFRTFESLEDTENAYDVSLNVGNTGVNELRSCNLRACEQLCRRLGFPGGACMGDKCKCDNFRTFESLEDNENANDMPLNTDVNELGRCNFRACEQFCKQLGFPSGACVGSRCKCDTFRTSEDELSEDSNTLRDCNYEECDQRCRRLGFPGGACVGNRCKCDNFRSVQFNRGLDSAKINSEYRSCNYHECDRRCRRLKFPGGACVNNRCKCDNFRQLLSNDAPSSIDETNNSLRDYVKCNSTQCKMSCTDRGLRNGICIEKECYCDMEDAEITAKVCEPIACNIGCHNMNHLGGLCEEENCKCI